MGVHNCFRVTDVSEREGGAASSAPVSTAGSRMPQGGVWGGRNSVLNQMGSR